MILVARLVPLAYGIKTLHITCVVEDDKVNILLIKVFKAILTNHI